MAESENSVISLITNAELVIQQFGYWPAFHDAEVLKVTLEANPGYEATAIFTIATHEFINELNLRGYYKQANNCNIKLQFKGIVEMSFESFNHQNVIFDLSFEKNGENIRCEFGASVGLVATIEVEDVSVLRLIPTEPEPDEPLIDIEVANMSKAANIVIASRDLTRTFDWSDWIYIGLNIDSANDYQTQKVAELTHTFFENEKVYLIIEDGEGSHLTTLSESLNQMSTLLKTNEVLLCNTSFTKAMKFNMIGVMSYGQKRS